jgi:hypothetical protein
VQVGDEQGMRSRSLIEAYGSNPQRTEDDGTVAIDQPEVVRSEDSELLRAFEFLDACLLREPHVERGLPPADSGAKSAPASDTPASGMTVDDPALRTAAVPGPAPADPDARTGSWRIPRGLLYWFGVGIAGGATWRLTSSLYEMTVAALAASAALIGLELLLRLIDPRLARRLGFARPHQGSSFYGAGAVLGVGTGLVIAHII